MNHLKKSIKYGNTISVLKEIFVYTLVEVQMKIYNLGSVSFY